jgi:hypothetical protein
MRLFVLSATCEQQRENKNEQSDRNRTSSLGMTNGETPHLRGGGFFSI